MITQDEFLTLAAARPEMMRGYQAAVRAIIDLRTEAAKGRRGFWASLKMKRLGVRAVFLTERLVDGFVYNGRPASEQEKECIRNWVIGTAEYQIRNSN